MARLDVHKLRRAGPEQLVVDVQSNFLDRLRTRAVVPLLLATAAPPPLPDLNPVFEINGASYLMATQLLAAIDRAELRPAIGSLDAYHDTITRALDVLLHGL